MDANTLQLLTLIVTSVIAPLVTRIWWKIEELHERVAYLEGLLGVRRKPTPAPAAREV